MRKRWRHLNSPQLPIGENCTTFYKSRGRSPNTRTSLPNPKYISSCRSHAEQPNVRTSFWRGFPKSPANHPALLLAMPPKYAFGILTSGPCWKAKVHKAGHQTWDLSKNLHDWIFGQKLSHTKSAQFATIFTKKETA